MKSEYLIFNLLIVSLSSLGVGLYKDGRWPKFKRAVISIFLLSAPYLIWDQIVTDNWWRFNKLYTQNIRFGKLPLEEIMFFLAVPWSCLVIWENLKRRIKGNWRINIEVFLIIGGIILGIWSGFENRWYSLAVCGAISAVAFMSWFTNRWLRKKSATLFLILVFILTVIFNGYLTSRPIVIYNSAVLSNIYLSTIPIEDLFYGLALISGIIMAYETGISVPYRK